MRSKPIPVRLLLAINIVLLFLYLPTCLLPFFNAEKFWMIALLGLIYPFLLAAVLFFFIGWLIARSKWSLLSLAALLLSWQQIAVVFSWHRHETFPVTKPLHHLRVLTWNLSSWGASAQSSSENKNVLPLMLAEINKQQADLLCLQEFESIKKKGQSKPSIELRKMGFAYQYYLPAKNGEPSEALGITIFSKYPIINTGIYDFGDHQSVQQLLYADILFEERKIRVFTIHLQSVRFEQQEYESIDEIKKREKSGFQDTRTIVGKLKRGYYYRSQQADIVKDLVQQSPNPVVLCGDFNDVPNSYTYFTVKNHLQDAFVQKGAGIGRTFRFISPTLRIDYIFADTAFTINRYHRIMAPYSDHYGVVADMSIAK